MRTKMIGGFLLIVLMLFVVAKNLKAQGHVNNKAYDIMLSSLLSHQVPEISVKDLDGNTSYIFLDAREYREYEVSHIPGATWVGYDDFQMSRIAHLNPDVPVVVYCSVGYRSEKITEKLKAAGYSNVQNLYGGIFEWVNAGKEVHDKAGVPTPQVHAYSKSWGVWLDRGEKVYK